MVYKSPRNKIPVHLATLSFWVQGYDLMYDVASSAGGVSTVPHWGRTDMHCVYAIGSVRCIIIPIDGDCALGFRCIEFTSCSIADEQFATLICSQLKSELAHIAAKTPGRKYDLLQILYDDTIVSQRIQLPGNKLSGVTMLFTIQLSECEICLTFRCQRCCFRVV